MLKIEIIGIDHMLRPETPQDITGGFNVFIPLVYQTEKQLFKK